MGLDQSSAFTLIFEGAYQAVSRPEFHGFFDTRVWEPKRKSCQDRIFGKGNFWVVLRHVEPGGWRRPFRFWKAFQDSST
jgi:hypothetical protein